VQGGVVETAARHQDPPRVGIGLHEGEEADGDGPEVRVGTVGPFGAVADPALETGDDADLHGIDEPTTVAEVGVDERARDAGGDGDLVEGDQQGIAFGQEGLGGVEDQRPLGGGVEPEGPGPGLAQVAAPARATSVTVVSPGARGWWQATNWSSLIGRMTGTSSVQR
jgi:hypothetical protein